jgi:PAS domain-containing protein
MSDIARMVRGRIRALSRAPSVAGQVFILQVLLALILASVAVAALALEARSHATQEARQRSLSVARAFAQGPGIAQAMTGDGPTALLQPRAEEVRKRTGVDSIVVFDRLGTRLTHPETALIGKRIVGPHSVVRQELAGKTIARTFRASQGLSVISAVPVTTAGGALTGGVSVGVRVESVNSEVDRQLPLLLGAGGGALALATAGTALAGRRLRRQTHGLGPAEMTRMYAHHDAVLHSVREGVLIMDADGRLLLVNDEARRLLRPGGGCPAPRRLRPADTGLGAGRGRLRRRADHQRTGHQRAAVRRPSRTGTAAARPQPDRRGIRRQQHLTPSAARGGDRRGRPGPVPGRPAGPALGHPLHPAGQGHLGRADAARSRSRTPKVTVRSPA